MNKFFNTKLTKFLKVQHPASVFNSISEPIYNSPESYLESIFFAFIDLIRRGENTEKYRKFSSTFKGKASQVKSYFKAHPEKLSRFSNDRFGKFTKMVDKLDRVLDGYEEKLFSSESEEALLDDLEKSRNGSAKYFKMIMKLLILSEINIQEEDEKTKKFVQEIIKDEFNVNSNLLNKIIAKVLQVNLIVFSMNVDEPKEYCFDKDKKKDMDYQIALLFDNNLCIRILSKETDLSLRRKEELQIMEEKKNKIEKKLKREIKDHKILEDLIYECYDTTIKNYLNYLATVFHKDTKQNISAAKQVYKLHLKAKQGEVLSKEQEMKEKYGLQIKGKGRFVEISNYMKSLKSDVQELITANSESNIFDNVNEQIGETLPTGPSCDKCNHKIFGEPIEFNCGCIICEQCFSEHLNRIYEFQIGDVDIPCCNPNCEMENLKLRFIKAPKSIELMEKYLGKKKLDEIRNLHKGRLMISGIKNQIMCIVCGELCRIEEIVCFDCDCKICEECCRHYLKAQVKDKMDGFEVPCFNDKCPAPKSRQGLKNGIYVFERLLGKEESEKICLALANKQAKFNCSNPACQLPFSLENENLSVFICECKWGTCLKCRKKMHIGKECNKVDDDLRDFLKQEGRMVRICPNPECLQPVIKDDHCDHVKCPICQVEFCFLCSCIRSPTMEHGNHYHRKDCKHYTPWIDKDGKDVLGDEFKKKCTECARLGKLCERPKQSIREFYTEKKKLEYLEMEDEEEEKDDGE